MNKVIWKFELQVMDEQSVAMPQGSEILSIQMQNNKPCMWAYVNPNAENSVRIIETYGTGYPIKTDVRKYIGTYQQGGFVGHVFEKLD